jgi:hypothetical protein
LTRRKGFDEVGRICTGKSARLETQSWMLARFSVLIPSDPITSG